MIVRKRQQEQAIGRHAYCECELLAEESHAIHTLPLIAIAIVLNTGLLNLYHRMNKWRSKSMFCDRIDLNYMPLPYKRPRSGRHSPSPEDWRFFREALLPATSRPQTFFTQMDQRLRTNKVDRRSGTKDRIARQRQTIRRSETRIRLLCGR